MSGYSLVFHCHKLPKTAKSFKSSDAYWTLIVNFRMICLLRAFCPSGRLSIRTFCPDDMSQDEMSSGWNVCWPTLLVKTKFVGFFWDFSRMLLNISRTANNGSVWCKWKVGECIFWGLHWPSNDKSTSYPEFNVQFKTLLLPFSMTGKEDRRERKVFTEFSKKLLRTSTCSEGVFREDGVRSQWKRGRAGEIWTWIGRGSDRVGSTKGYEGEELEGRVEWLLGGSSTECRDNKLSSAGINHHLQCSTPVTQLPLFNILVSPKHRNSLHNSVEICFN